MKIKDKKFEIAISAETIQKRVSEIAAHINENMCNKEVVIVSILNGSFMFASDLIKQINFDVKISFVKLSSYDVNSSSGNIKRLIGINEDLKDKTILVIEDIIDTGLTIDKIIRELNVFQPKEIIIAALLFKKSQLVCNFDLNYIGFEVGKEFLIGYGLDYAGYGRNYPAIYKLIQTIKPGIHNILIFGAPGAGKGTQSRKIIEKYNLVHLSTGDILRYAIETNTKLGQMAKLHMDKGGFVPDDVVLNLIEQRLDMNEGTNGFIFDGFPRTVEQAIGLEKLMMKKNMSITGMIALQVETDELKNRLIERGKHGNRSDDTPEIIENRIRIYHERTAQVAEFFKSRGMFYQVNGSGEINEIFENISKIIDAF